MKKIILLGNYTPSHHAACNIYHTEGISPTVMENHNLVVTIMEIIEYEECPIISIPEGSE